MFALRECREKRGLSQKYVAVSLGVAPPQVSKWESGQTKPTLDNLIGLADLYRVTLDELLGREFQQNVGGLSNMERRLLIAWRASDPVGREDALSLLERHAAKTKDAAVS